MQAGPLSITIGGNQDGGEVLLPEVNFFKLVESKLRQFCLSRRERTTKNRSRF